MELSSFLCQERKDVSSCRLSGKRSPLLSREVGGLVCYFGMGSSCGGSFLLVENEAENLHVEIEDWGALSYSLGAGASSLRS